MKFVPLPMSFFNGNVDYFCDLIKHAIANVKS